MIRKNNKYDKYNILNNKLYIQMSQDNNKFDLKKFNDDMNKENIKKKELRLAKEKKELEDMEEIIDIKEKTTLLFYFNNWLFSIPKLLGYIMTLNYDKIINDSDNDELVLYIGIWFIFIGIIFYVFFDFFQKDSK
jgi:hypothetical protein